MRRLFLALFVAAGIVTAAEAQQPAPPEAARVPLTPGSRLRVTVANNPVPITGTLVAAVGDSLTIDTGHLVCSSTGCGPFVTHLDYVERLQIGTKTREQKRVIGLATTIAGLAL